MQSIPTNQNDHYGDPIFVGSKLFNVKLNFVEPRIWEVKQRKDGLFYCEGITNKGAIKYIALKELLNHLLVFIKVLEGKKQLN